MRRVKRDLQIEKLKGGLDQTDQDKIDSFFSKLNDAVSLPELYKNLLISHFISAFDYYLDNDKDVDYICDMLDLKNLGDFYSDRKRKNYALDNAAIVYPLGMRYGQMPMFRLSCELKEDTRPALLQVALDFTIKRFPCYSAIIKTGFFWHYLETTNNIHLIEEEKDIPCRPISIVLRSKRSMRVLYYKKRISVEFFHTLCDGSGGMIFLKTLLGE